MFTVCLCAALYWGEIPTQATLINGFLIQGSLFRNYETLQYISTSKDLETQFQCSLKKDISFLIRSLPNSVYLQQIKYLILLTCQSHLQKSAYMQSFQDACISNERVRAFNRHFFSVWMGKNTKCHSGCRTSRTLILNPSSLEIFVFSAFPLVCDHPCCAGFCDIVFSNPCCQQTFPWWDMKDWLIESCAAKPHWEAEHVNCSVTGMFHIPLASQY